MLRQVSVTTSNLPAWHSRKPTIIWRQRHRLQDEVFLSEVSSLDISIARRTDLALGTVQREYGVSVIESLFYKEDICPDWSDCLLSEALLDLSVRRAGNLTSCAGYIANKLSSSFNIEDCLSALYASDLKASKIGSLLCVKENGAFPLLKVCAES